LPLIADTYVVAGMILVALIALPLGFYLGIRHSRVAKRALQRELSARSIEALEHRSRAGRFEADLNAQPRHERVARVALERLARARSIASQRYLDETTARLAAAEAEGQALRYSRVASMASRRIKELETEINALRVAGGNKASASEGSTAAMNDSAVEFTGKTPAARSHVREEPIDIPRITPAAPRPGGLSLIDGLVEDDEDRLNELGIHDIAQLACLSESEQKSLRSLIDKPSGPRPVGVWVGNARALLRSQSA